jgi:hypothetical protein
MASIRDDSRACSSFDKLLRLLLLAAVVAGVSAPSLAYSSTITFAGFAYAGNANSIETRFKYSKRYEKSIIQKGSNVSAVLRHVLAGRSAGHRRPG